MQMIPDLGKKKTVIFNKSTVLIIEEPQNGLLARKIEILSNYVLCTLW